MPTQLQRTQITHTPPVERALAAARSRWAGERAGELLVHLIETGGEALLAEQEAQQKERAATLERVSTRYAGLFGDGYLEELREDWPA